MTDRQLKLSLSAGELLPTSLNWIIDAGYVRLATHDEEQNRTTLGIYGPGDLAIPALLRCSNLQLTALSAVEVKECSPTPEQKQSCIQQQMLQLAVLLKLARVRSAELRLYNTLLWLGERFGQVGSQGVSLSFEAMNLTHRNLAEITGMTRVTVTKALIHFRKEGRLLQQDSRELLIGVSGTLPQLPEPNDYES